MEDLDGFGHVDFAQLLIKNLMATLLLVSKQKCRSQLAACRVLQYNLPSELFPEFDSVFVSPL